MQKPYNSINLEGKANNVTWRYIASSILYHLHDNFQLPKCNGSGQVSRRIIQTASTNGLDYLIECPTTEMAVTCLSDSLKLLLQILFVGRSNFSGTSYCSSYNAKRLCCGLVV